MIDLIKQNKDLVILLKVSYIFAVLNKEKKKTLTPNVFYEIRNRLDSFKEFDKYFSNDLELDEDYIILDYPLRDYYLMNYSESKGLIKTIAKVFYLINKNNDDKLRDFLKDFLKTDKKTNQELIYINEFRNCLNGFYKNERHSFERVLIERNMTFNTFRASFDDLLNDESDIIESYYTTIGEYIGEALIKNELSDLLEEKTMRKRLNENEIKEIDKKVNEILLYAHNNDIEFEINDIIKLFAFDEKTKNYLMQEEVNIEDIIDDFESKKEDYNPEARIIKIITSPENTEIMRIRNAISTIQQGDIEKYEQELLDLEEKDTLTPEEEDYKENLKDLIKKAKQEREELKARLSNIKEDLGLLKKGQEEAPTQYEKNNYNKLIKKKDKEREDIEQQLVARGPFFQQNLFTDDLEYKGKNVLITIPKNYDIKGNLTDEGNNLLYYLGDKIEKDLQKEIRGQEEKTRHWYMIDGDDYLDFTGRKNYDRTIKNALKSAYAMNKETYSILKENKKSGVTESITGRLFHIIDEIEVTKNLDTNKMTFKVKPSDTYIEMCKNSIKYNNVGSIPRAIFRLGQGQNKTEKRLKSIVLYMYELIKIEFRKIEKETLYNKDLKLKTIIERLRKDGLLSNKVVKSYYLDVVKPIQEMLALGEDLGLLNYKDKYKVFETFDKATEEYKKGSKIQDFENTSISLYIVANNEATKKIFKRKDKKKKAR